MEVKEATFASSKQKAIQNSPLVEVSEVTRFNGEHAYDVVYGKTEENQPGYAFVPIVNEKDDEVDQEEEQQLETLFVLEEEGIREQEMLAKWKENCRNCTLEKMTPGIANDNFVWEIIYKNEQDKFVFSYYLFSTGSLLEQLK